MSSYDAGHPSPYAEAPQAAAYGQSASAYTPQGPAAYDPQLLGYDQAPADPLGASYPAVTGDPLTDPLDPAPPTGRRARTGDPLTDPLDPPAAQATTPAPNPAPRRHAGRPAVEEQQQEPYRAPAHGRHAGGAAPAGAAEGAAAGAAPSGHRDPSPWGDLSAAAHAGAPATADPAQAQTAQPHARQQARQQTQVQAPAPAPPPAARIPDQAANGDQRLTWGTAPASRRRGIADDGREGRGDREDRTVQTMSLNVARALGTRMSARKAARAAKQQRTVLLSRITGEAFITLGVLMLLFVVYQLWWTNVLADRESRQEAQQLEEQWKRGDGAGKEDARDPGAFEAGEGFAIMHIPSLDVNRPVAQGINKQKVLDRGLLGHYSEGDLKTAMPWDEKGNFAVAGHRNTHGEPFRYINRLEKGEEIIVETKDTYYIYEVSSTLPSTSPSNTDVIDPVPEGSGFTGPGRYVTLTTCTPEYTSKYRLIVWGKMIEERPRSEGKPDALMD
ncbi:class E sortase [Streptomyces sp. CMB-StM0423]|uniref:class E sortase n=1 Tax=Streptomyces sp. CMB-StM0423 TaxID=2059884 RepID=UPI003FA36765